MPNRSITRRVLKSPKTKWMLGGWVLLELTALPAAAQVVHTVSFRVEPHVVAAPIPSDTPGRLDFVVSSNAPFNVTAADMVGELDVVVTQSGMLGEQAFGQASQLPGASQSCARLTSPAGAVVYRAARRTAAARGDGVEQAVIISFHFDPVAAPSIAFTVEPQPVVAQECAGDALS